MQKPQFFPANILSKKKLLFFQTIESAKGAFAVRAGSGKRAFLHALFLENEKQNSSKNYRTVLSQVQGHMQKFSSFGGKKKMA